MNRAKEVAKLLGEKHTLYNRIRGTLSPEYYATVAFVEEFFPPRFSSRGIADRIPLVSR